VQFTEILHFFLFFLLIVETKFGKSENKKITQRCAINALMLLAGQEKMCLITYSNNCTFCSKSKFTISFT